MPLTRLQLGASLFALCVGMSLAVMPVRAIGTYPVLPAGTRGPVHIAFAADGRHAYVAESDTGTVAVIECASGTVTRRFPALGKGVASVCPTPDGGLLVANSFSGDVQLLDASTGLRRASLR